MDFKINAAVSVIVKLLRGIPLKQEEAANWQYYCYEQPIDNGMLGATVGLFELKLRQKLTNLFKNQPEAENGTHMKLEVGPGERMDTFVRETAREVGVPEDKLNAMMPCVIWINPKSVMVFDLELRLIWAYRGPVGM